MTIRTTLAVGALAALVIGAAAAKAASVEVTLTGVQPRGGHIYAALQTHDQFMRKAMVAGEKLVGDARGTVRFTLANVPEGDYALSVLHDADDNHTMTLASDGRPKEGWTMLNGARLRGEPTFDQVSTHVGAGGATLTLPMIYPAD